MKYIKMMSLIACSVMALMGLGASGASATTLEIGGVIQNESVTIAASLKSGSSLVLKDTAGFTQSTCTTASIHGVTTLFTGTNVAGPLTGHTSKEKEEGVSPEAGLSINGCTRFLKVDNSGTVYIKHIANTTNGTVSSQEAEVTVGSAIGTLTCRTGAFTHLGTLTGVASEHATLHLNAVIHCGIIPSAKWEATWSITTPTGLGVSG